MMALSFSFTAATSEEQIYRFFSSTSTGQLVPMLLAKCVAQVDSELETFGKFSVSSVVVYGNVARLLPTEPSVVL